MKINVLLITPLLAATTNQKPFTKISFGLFPLNPAPDFDSTILQETKLQRCKEHNIMPFLISTP